MIINLKTLPLSIYKKIPLSIKTLKDEYDLDDLPYSVQKLILDINQQKEIDYKDSVYDFQPQITELGDFKPIENLKILVVDYMYNYLHTLLGEYPFNCLVGSNVKKLLQKKDTTIQKLYMSEELNRMIMSFGTTIDKNIKLKTFDLSKKDHNVYVEYTYTIELIIDDEPTTLSQSYIL